MAGKKASESAEKDTGAETLGFEAALRVVEQSVAALESGTLDLDDALKAYEKAVQLLERCHRLLEAAEQRVTILTGTNADGTPKIEPFDAAPN